MAVTPPSVHHSGTPYKVISKAPLAEAPAWLIEEIESLKKKNATATVTEGDGELIPKGQRDDWLTSQAGRMWGDGWSVDQIRPELHRLYQEKCSHEEPEITDADIEAKLAQCPTWKRSERGHQLARLNEEVVLIEHPGLVLVLPREDHPENQQRFRLTTVDKFKTEQFADRTYRNSDGKRISVAKEWVTWEARRKADSIIFEPGKDQMVGNQFNVWEDWPYKPAEGDVTPFIELIEHIFKDVDPQYKKWFLQWLAYPIQHPGTKLYTAVVMWGAQGVGKSLIGQTIGRIYGRGFAKINQRILNSEFNERQQNCMFALGDELTSGQQRGIADILKDLITSESNFINQKGVSRYETRDFANYYFTSNHQDAFFLEGDDRRYFVHQAPSEKPTDEFFARYDVWLRSDECPAALMHHLQNKVPLEGFNPRAAAPDTEAKQDMKQGSLSDADRWCEELRENPDGVLNTPGKDEKAVKLPGTLFSTSWLLSLYSQQFKMQHDKRPDITENGFGKALNKARIPKVYGGNPIKIPGELNRVRLWRVRDRDVNLLNVNELAWEYAKQLNPFIKEPKSKSKSESKKHGKTAAGSGLRVMKK